MTRRLLIWVLACGAAAVGCTSTGNGPSGDLDTSFSAQMASSWHYVGAPQRVEVGIVASDTQGIRFVTQGTIDVTFDYLGPDGGDAPEPGPTATARYVPVPGTDGSGSSPTLTAGARGVYEADDVSFDRPGAWRATLTAEIDTVSRRLTVTFPVTDRSPIPAPGEPALRTENLTLESKGIRAGAIDSRADAGGEIPDPELHRWTIADAVKQGRPALVLFGTPAYCTSQFCGPEVEELQRFAAEYPDRAVYIHIEIWKEYRPPDVQVVNRAAADWLLRNGDMTEPWLYLIGADGIIADRWGSLFDPADVAAALEALPPMAS